MLSISTTTSALFSISLHSSFVLFTSSCLIDISVEFISSFSILSIQSRIRMNFLVSSYSLPCTSLRISLSPVHIDDVLSMNEKENRTWCLFEMNSSEPIEKNINRERFLHLNRKCYRFDIIR